MRRVVRLGFDFGSGLVQVNTFTNARNLRDLAMGTQRVQNMPFDYVNSSGMSTARGVRPSASRPIP
jgi:hypothetical protein